MAVKVNKRPPTLKIKPGTPEMEAHLQAGYDMSIEEAQRIIAERDKNPASIPYEKYEEAKAMLAAFNATPKAISKTPGWKRKPLPEEA